MNPLLSILGPVLNVLKDVFGGLFIYFSGKKAANNEALVDQMAKVEEVAKLDARVANRTTTDKRSSLRKRNKKR